MPRRDARSVNNPPAHPHRVGQGRVRPCLSISSQNPSLPGSACPAEACTFTCFFSCFFCFLFFGPKFHPRPPQWPPQGSQNPSNFGFFSQKCVPRAAFLSIFVANSFFFVFLVHFGCFFNEKSMFFCPVFGDVCVFFQHADPYDSTQKPIRNRLFHILRFLFFFDKKGQKNIQNFSAKKSLEKDHTWHPKSIQNPLISAFLGTKIAPERLKKLFFGVSFFACFFDVLFLHFL